MAFAGRPTSLVFLLSLGRAAVLHEVRDEVDGQREDDGRVLLRRNRVEGLKKKGSGGLSLVAAPLNPIIVWTCLQVSQLEGGGGLCDDLGGLFQGPRGLLLALCGDDLKEREGTR